MSASEPKSIAVVGAGITGLSAARELHRAGLSVTVFEKNPRVGGAITTLEKDGWLIEGGPNSLQETPDVTALLAELGLTDCRLIANPAAKNRYILRDGKLVAAPLSPPGLLTSPLFSLGARARVLSELLARPRVRTTDTSLASFIDGHFGREVVDYALNPFVAGVYAGDPEKLSARYAFPRLWQLERTHGSLLRGYRAEAREKRARGDPAGAPPVISFEHGLQTLPDALAATLPAGTIKTNATITNIIPGRPWKVIHAQAGTVETTEFDGIALALPANGLAQLVFGKLGERVLASLDHQPHPPLSSLFLGFRREQITHTLDGFGALIPAREHRTLLGVLFSSSLFAHRAPEGHVALTVFAGGTRQPETARLSTAALVDRVLPDLRTLLGITGDPVFTHHTFWPKAIPQYNLGHERFVEPLTRAENDHPGLFIGGNTRDGISLPDCIKAGHTLAERCVKFVGTAEFGKK